MDPWEITVSIQQILVSSTAADYSKTACRCPAERNPPLQVRVVFILYRKRRINLDQLTEPKGHPLDHRHVFVGVITTIPQKIFYSVALGCIKSSKVRTLFGIRLQSFIDFRTSRFIKRKCIVIDSHVIQITQFFPGRIHIFCFIIRLAA